MTGASRGERGFQRNIAPIVGAIPAVGVAAFIVYVALTFPELAASAWVLATLAGAMILTAGAAIAILLIGYRVPQLVRLGSAIALAAAMGANATLVLQPTAAMNATSITEGITYMLLSAILVLAGITSMCTNTDRAEVEVRHPHVG